MAIKNCSYISRQALHDRFIFEEITKKAGKIVIKPLKSAGRNKQDG